MSRIPAVVLLACSLALRAEPRDGLSIDSRLAVPGGLVLRCDGRVGEGRFVLLFEGQDSRTVFLCAGAELPWLAVGPLSPTGLLREAANPLGFGPGSDVFAEATGLRLDASPEGSAGTSILVSPIPGSVSLFARSFAEQTGEFGCIGCLGESGPVSLEALACLSNPPAAIATEEWLTPSPAYPGGKLLLVATRIMVRTEACTGALSGGSSWPELEAPGLFLHAAGTAGGDAGSLELFAGTASPGLRTSRGHTPSDCAASGARVHLATAGASLEASYSKSVERPAPIPGLFLGTREQVAFRLERSGDLAAAARLRVRLEGEKRIAIDRSGRQTSRGSAAFSLGLESPRGAFEAGARFEDPGGASLLAAGHLGHSLAIELQLQTAAGGPLRASGRLSMRWVRPASSLELRLEFEGVPLTAGTDADADSRVRAAVEWHAGPQ